ncbi:RDD family protein [Chryseobacterium sp.]|uniref:RDD family protein n=1 Tax=Chryseobacterium sp. TaxID=1871047 RepID=UPI0028970E57|nr:RDD family protein [Chryseobacterium sp.]
MRKYLKIVHNNQASKGSRFANYLIDIIAISVINIILSTASILLYNMTSINFFYFYNNGGFLWEYLSGSFVILIYYYLWESLTDGRSLGKLVTNTKVISIDGEKPTRQQILYRCLSRVVPFDAISFLGGGNGWHDNWSDTNVINIKNYEAEIQIKSEIDSLGTKEIA